MCRTNVTHPPTWSVPQNGPETDRKRSWPGSLKLLLGALACAFLANAQTSPTTTVLSANATVAYSGAPVALEATVTAGATKVVAGQIRFQDGARVLGVLQGVAQSNGSLTAGLIARLTGGVSH